MSNSVIRFSVNLLFPFRPVRLARDGQRITKAIIDKGDYESISGNSIHIDDNGDSQGNFTAFALKEHEYTYKSSISGEIKFQCRHFLIKVGDFHYNANSTTRNENTSKGRNATAAAAAARPVTYVPRLNIDWPNKFRPVDEPHCGYDGSKCKRPGGRTEIAAGVLGALLLMAIILTLSMYRRWKIEQEIEGLLWKINPECLQVLCAHTAFRLSVRFRFEATACSTRTSGESGLHKRPNRSPQMKA